MALTGAAPAQRIEGTTLRDPVEPGGWVPRPPAGSGPSRRRPCAGLGERLLRNVEVAEAGGERGNDAPARLPRRAVERGGAHPPGKSSGLISTAASCNTGSFLAMAIAASRSGTSIK